MTALIRRTLSARRLNAVANHPQVRPMLGGEGPLDLSALAADPANLVFEAEGGGWAFLRHAAGTYEVHSLFLPEGRGAPCLAAWREAERFMFAETDAREIVTRVPGHNRPAMGAARAAGFRTRFRREAAFRTAEGTLVRVAYMARTLDDWWPLDPAALERGRAFHARLETALAASGLPEHPPDETHDRAAGAACLMTAAGNGRKAVWFYNRWAALAGYGPIRLMSETPLVVDLGAGVAVQVRGGGMEVIGCP